MIRILPMFLLCACGPGLAVPAVLIEVAPEQRFEVLPDQAQVLEVELFNAGTGAAQLKATADDPFGVVADSVLVGAGATGVVALTLTTDGYDDQFGELVLTEGALTWSTALVAIVQRDVDGDGHDALGAGGGDCDDNNPEIAPGMFDGCDGVDQDCDGDIDEDALLEEFWPDEDGDGWGDGAAVMACAAPIGTASTDGDCDDDDPERHPGAKEIWYDGVDQDCSGGSDDDQDADGVAVDLDCDDQNPQARPGANESPDGVDNDCDGWVDEDFVGVGDLVFTEFFTDPTSAAAGTAEWLELVNVSSTHVDLSLVDIDVDGINHSLPAVVLAPLDVLLLCSSPEPSLNGGITCDGEIGIPTRASVFRSTSAGVVIDQVDLTGWALTPGRAMELGSASWNASDNDNASAWCTAVSTFGDRAGDRGTPGLLLPPC